MPVEYTPDRISPLVREFCRSIQPNENPIFIAVEPQSEAAFNGCFLVVKQHCERNGGRPIYGWAIWVWSHVWIKAEHHAVWETPDGTLVDITPKANRSQRIVFLPDPERVYDFEMNRRIDNIRKALRGDSDIKDLFAAEKHIFEYEEANTIKGSLRIGGDLQEYYSFRRDKDLIFTKLIKKYLRSRV